MVSSDLRAYIKEIKPTCEYCKKHPTEEIHHVDCNKKNNTVANLMAVCKKCHRAKGNKAEIHPMNVIHRIFKKFGIEYKKSRYSNFSPFYHLLKKYLLKRCPSNCICLKRK